MHLLLPQLQCRHHPHLLMLVLLLHHLRIGEGTLIYCSYSTGAHTNSKSHVYYTCSFFIQTMKKQDNFHNRSSNVLLREDASKSVCREIVIEIVNCASVVGELTVNHKFETAQMKVSLEKSIKQVKEIETVLSTGVGVQVVKEVEPSVIIDTLKPGARTIRERLLALRIKQNETELQKENEIQTLRSKVDELQSHIEQESFKAGQERNKKVLGHIFTLIVDTKVFQSYVLPFLEMRDI